MSAYITMYRYLCKKIAPIIEKAFNMNKGNCVYSKDFTVYFKVLVQVQPVTRRFMYDLAEEIHFSD